MKAPNLYLRGSVVLTSDIGFAEWGQLLDDSVVAAATLDRMLYHSHVINIRGASYRLKDKQQAGVLAGHTLVTSKKEDDSPPD